MEITIKTKEKNNSEIINTITIFAKPTNIIKIKDILDSISVEQWSVSDYLINETKIDPLKYLQGWLDIDEYSESEHFLGKILSYGLIDENIIKFEITSYTEYDKDMIEYFFLQNIIDTEEDRQDKIKEYEEKIEYLKSQIEEYKNKLDEIKNLKF